MKILYWTGLFWPHIGGVEVLSLEFIPAMQKKGYEFIVLTSQTNSSLSQRENYNGIDIYRIPFYRGLENHNLQEIKQTIQLVAELKGSFKPDLIHVNSIDASIYFHLLTDNSAEDIPTLFTVHSLPPYGINDNTLVKKMLNSAKWITTASGSMFKAVRNIMDNDNPQNLSLIYYGMNLPDVKPAPLPFNPPRLLCLGRLASEKGFDVAIDAFADVVNKFPEARLVIAGDGPERIELQNKTEKLGLTNSIDFTGWVVPEKVSDLITNSTIVIIPSRWEEPFGLVALQAAQLARPVIASSTGGLPEIIEHGSTGFLFVKEDKRAASEKIITLLQNPDLAMLMGNNARNKVMKMFSFDQFIDSYDQLYKKIIRSHRQLNNSEFPAFSRQEN